MNGLSGDVLITGGAGFLGRAILARAQRERWDARFTVLSRDDYKHSLVRARFPDVRFVRADICGDVETLAAAMRGHDLVIHAAAVKYVDVSEWSVWDTLRVNVDGSRHVARAAVEAGVAQVIGVSTDKACDARNVYGMTKALMERAFLEADGWSPATGFACVRYGNVIASTGSVIPMFQRQLAETGTVRITSTDMTRFWMDVDEAITLICDAATARGEVVIPNARSMSLVALAWCLGATATQMQIIGLRPGEKLHETLISESEIARAREAYAPSGLFRWYLPAPGAGSMARSSPEIPAVTSADADPFPASEMREAIARAAHV